MKRSLSRLALFVIALALPAFAHAQGVQQRRAVETEKKYVLFIHAGPVSPTHDVVKKISVELARSGYLVRAPDGDMDAIGGPGVDYFDDATLPKAQEVANAVNNQFAKLGIQVADNDKLKPRRQSVKNPPEYLGVWLFDKDVKLPAGRGY